MRRIGLVMLGAALGASSLSAQFEGTMHVKMSALGSQSSDVTYMIKGQRAAYSMTNPMMGGEMHAIVDGQAQKITILMPATGQMASMLAQMPGMEGAKGFTMTMDMNQAAAGAPATPPTWKDMGTSQMIAGYKCEDFDLTSEGKVTHVCLAKELGTFAMATGGAPGGRRGAGGGAPAWVSALGSMGFPLKVVTPDGKVSMEVTSIQKGAVPESAFQIPDGYKPMPNFPGMMGGRGGGGGGTR